MTTPLSRRAALVRVAATSAAVALAASGARAQTGPGTATPAGTPGGLIHRGINYDVGTQIDPTFHSRPDAHRAFLADELAAIHNDLHCTTVGIYGDSTERLIEGATAALETGLHVRLQPRLIDVPPEEMVPRVAEVAAAAEELRGGDHEVILDVGCELTLLGGGIIPGATFAERLAYLPEHLDELPAFSEALNGVLDQTMAAVRESFAGEITYSSGAWEAVDWDGIDIVGVDLYRDATNAAMYTDLLRAYHQHGKPVWITEFGCCCYEGAAEAGAGGFGIIDWTTTPPSVTGDLTRSEAEQARYVGELLDLYAAEGIAGAFVYQFIEPHLPHRPDDPQHDLDMGSFGVVKVAPPEAAQSYDTTGHREPKEAFAAIAGRYGGSPATPEATPVTAA